MRDLRADPDVGALVLYCRDVTSRAPAPGVDSELLELSLTDPVTGLKVQPLADKDKQKICARFIREVGQRFGEI